MKPGYEFNRELDNVKNQARAVNDMPLIALTEQVEDLVQTLQYNLDILINTPLISRTSQHERDINVLLNDVGRIETNINLLVDQVNNFVKHVTEEHILVIKEVDKIKRVLNFVLGDRIPEDTKI